jgi:predicted MFS family arabinose efflux permease
MSSASSGSSAAEGERRAPVLGPIALLGAVIVTAVGLQQVAIQPILVQTFVAKLGLTENNAGYVASAELFGMALATIASIVALERVRWRRLVLIVSVCLLCTDLISIAVTHFIPLLIVRFAAGVFEGVLTSVGYAMLAFARRPDRGIALALAVLLSFGAACVLLFPQALQTIGAEGIFATLGVISVVPAFLVRHVPNHGGAPTTKIENEAVGGAAYFALGAIATFFVGVGAVTPYLFLIGTNIGLADQVVALGISASLIAGVLGALFALIACDLLPPIVVTIAAILVTGLPVLLLHKGLSGLEFGIIACLFNGVGTMAAPLVIAPVAAFDRTGRLTAIAAAIQICAFAFGPFLSALLVKPGSYGAVESTAAVLFVVSAALVPIPLKAISLRAAESVWRVGTRPWHL